MGMLHKLKSVAAITMVAAVAASAIQWVSHANDDQKSVRRHIVEIRDFEYSQLAGAIKPGDIVTWINKDLVPHTATAIGESWDTGNILPGEMKSITITDTMIDRYICRFHPVMKSALPLDRLRDEIDVSDPG